MIRPWLPVSALGRAACWRTRGEPRLQRFQQPQCRGGRCGRLDSELFSRPGKRCSRRSSSGCRRLSALISTRSPWRSARRVPQRLAARSPGSPGTPRRPPGLTMSRYAILAEAGNEAKIRHGLRAITESEPLSCRSARSPLLNVESVFLLPDRHCSMHAHRMTLISGGHRNASSST
jgi:hypothetical protein